MPYHFCHLNSDADSFLCCNVNNMQRTFLFVLFTYYIDGNTVVLTDLWYSIVSFLHSGNYKWTDFF